MRVNKKVLVRTSRGRVRITVPRHTAAAPTEMQAYGFYVRNLGGNAMRGSPANEEVVEEANRAMYLSKVVKRKEKGRWEESQSKGEDVEGGEEADVLIQDQGAMGPIENVLPQVDDERPVEVEEALPQGNERMEECQSTGEGVQPEREEDDAIIQGADTPSENVLLQGEEGGKAPPQGQGVERSGDKRSGDDDDVIYLGEVRWGDKLKSLRNEKPGRGQEEVLPKGKANSEAQHEEEDEDVLLSTDEEDHPQYESAGRGVQSGGEESSGNEEDNDSEESAEGESSGESAVEAILSDGEESSGDEEECDSEGESAEGEISKESAVEAIQSDGEESQEDEEESSGESAGYESTGEAVHSEEDEEEMIDETPEEVSTGESGDDECTGEMADDESEGEEAQSGEEGSDDEEVVARESAEELSAGESGEDACARESAASGEDENAGESGEDRSEEKDSAEDGEGVAGESAEEESPGDAVQAEGEDDSDYEALSRGEETLSASEEEETPEDEAQAQPPHLEAGPSSRRTPRNRKARAEEEDKPPHLYKKDLPGPSRGRPRTRELRQTVEVQPQLQGQTRGRSQKRQVLQARRKRRTKPVEKYPERKYFPLPPRPPRVRGNRSPSVSESYDPRVVIFQCGKKDCPACNSEGFRECEREVRRKLLAGLKKQHKNHN